MGVSSAVNVWGTDSSSMASNGTRTWRVIYGCVVSPASGTPQTPVNISSSGRCAGRLVVTWIN
jgi:hypothetical protein